MERSWRGGGSPSRLDQKTPRQGSAVLRDTTIMGGSIARLANPRVKAKVAHELLRRREPRGIPDRRHQPDRDRQLMPVIVINRRTRSSPSPMFARLASTWRRSTASRSSSASQPLIVARSSSSSGCDRKPRPALAREQIPLVRQDQIGYAARSVPGSSPAYATARSSPAERPDDVTVPCSRRAARPPVGIRRNVTWRVLRHRSCRS